MQAKQATQSGKVGQAGEVAERATGPAAGRAASFDSSMSAGLALLLAAANCLILANMYYAQPIIGDIAASMGVSTAAAGSVVTVAQIGYCAGVLFLVPLGDVLENRRLITFQVLLAACALFVTAVSGSAAVFLCAMFFVGVFSCAVQTIVPLGLRLAAPHERGRVVGLIMAGAILGIVLARPLASWATGMFGWRALYFAASALMAVLALALYRHLPRTDSGTGGFSYVAMLRSMAGLLGSTPGLRPRLLLQATVFTTFTMFWAAAPLALREQLAFTHGEVALFSLASLIAPVCAALSGRMVDRGLGFHTTVVGITLIALAFLATPVFGLLAMPMVVAVLLLDPGVHSTNVVTQQGVLGLVPEARSRLNAICVACTFTGGAIGSSLGPWLYSHFGWTSVSLTGLVLTATAMLINFGLVRRAS